MLRRASEPKPCRSSNESPFHSNLQPRCSSASSWEHLTHYSVSHSANRGKASSSIVAVQITPADLVQDLNHFNPCF
ncbi:hypothetical protein CHARACLAT_032449 [Characodon lateralis]|uniref:Uncharacterized protein n=1 Tax=Characodon lateralis TaxID=208331 RepID=A0ABU7DDT9_9TELE|nr:hypothetical protein [Characodon lateralis]